MQKCKIRHGVAVWQVGQACRQQAWGTGQSEGERQGEIRNWLTSREKTEEQRRSDFYRSATVKLARTGVVTSQLLSAQDDE